MSNISIIAASSLSANWASILCAEGHSVETFQPDVDHDDLIQGEAPDILIQDVQTPDFEETKLIAHAAAAWPDCKTIAVVPDCTFRRSAICRTGLWAPDQMLIKPVNHRLLTATVSLLWAQVRSKRIIDQVRHDRVMCFPGQEGRRGMLVRNHWPPTHLQHRHAPRSRDLN